MAVSQAVFRVRMMAKNYEARRKRHFVASVRAPSRGPGVSRRPFALGEIYANGETGAVDRSKAVPYLLLAWENGNQDAVSLLKALDAYPDEPRGFIRRFKSWFARVRGA